MLTTMSPPRAHNSRPIPAALYDVTKAKLQQLVDMKIIAKVPVGDTSPWCSQMHVVIKKNKKTEGKPTMNDIRITIDPRDLNEAVQREYYPLKSIEEITTRTNGSKFFSHIRCQYGLFPDSTR